LPLAFEGLRILHLSDFHVGSFDSTDAVARGLQLAQSTRPDVVLFTGDIVNQRSSELDNWANLFATLRAPMGVFSVRGNHDYGRYFPDFTPQECEADGQRLLGLQRQMGYTPLEDEHIWLSRGTSRIAIVGMGNWGKMSPVKAGNLDRAVRGLGQPDAFKLLMSHDPSAWDALIRPHPLTFHLTLSGHTHGMQMGIDYEAFRWSPIQLKYPQWADLYREGNEHIYVNRGFGYVLFPGRVGVPPEIAVLTLRRGNPRA
jgi:predicted MPP superfamily phosphohydrolase